MASSAEPRTGLLGPAEAARPNPHTPGAALMLLMLANVCALLATALWVGFPYLRREHVRLDLWEGLLIWTADIASLLWFARCAASCWTDKRPACERVNIEAFPKALACVLAFDFGITLYFLHRDNAMLENASTAAGEVYGIEASRQNDDRIFRLHCRFRDRLGTQHTSQFAIRTAMNSGDDDRNAICDQLQRGAVPFPVQVSYVAGSPHKSWLSGLERQTGGTLHVLSLALVGLQAFLMLPLAHFLIGLQKQGEEFSQWAYDIFQGLPLVVEAFILLVWGATRAL